MDKLKYVKIENEDGSLSDNIPLGVDAENVDVTSADNSQNLADYISVNDGKINSINSQIDNLQDNNTSLSNQIKSLSSGSPKGSYATVSALKSANPETGVYVVTENGHIYSWTKDGDEAIDLGVYQAVEIENNSVTPEKTSFLSTKIISDNIFNKQDFTENSLISVTGKLLENNNGYGTSGFIKIDAENIGKRLFFSKYNAPAGGFYDALTIFRVVAFDANKNVIEFSGNYITSYIIPENTVYIRFSFSQQFLNNFQARFDGIVQTYGEYKELYDFSEDVDGKCIYNESITNDKLKNGTITEDKLDADLKEKIVNPKLEQVNLLLPNKIFMIEEEPLRLYKSSIIYPQKYISDVRIGLLSEFNFYTNKKQPFVEFLNEKLDIKTSDIDDTLKIRMMNNLLGTLYGKNIDVVKCNATNVANKTPVVNMFGDSTTYGGVILPIRQTFTKYNINPNFIGTKQSGTGENAEARSGYCYANYIGYRTVNGNDELAEFPNFLKLATAEDKANHPDWCYTRSSNGSAKEKTYSEVVAENGDIDQDFYIFDYSNYLDINTYSTPDIVTFGMGINDYWKYEEDATEICKKALTIMINQIHSAVPSAKIGIIPFPINGEEKDYKLEWLNTVLDLVQSFNTNFESNVVDVVPEYISQSRELGFNYTETNTNYKSYNKYTISDAVHTALWGYTEGGKAIAYYMINQL